MPDTARAGRIATETPALSAWSLQFSFTWLVCRVNEGEIGPHLDGCLGSGFVCQAKKPNYRTGRWAGRLPGQKKSTGQVSVLCTLSPLYFSPVPGQGLSFLPSNVGSTHPWAQRSQWQQQWLLSPSCHFHSHLQNTNTCRMTFHYRESKSLLASSSKNCPTASCPDSKMIILSKLLWGEQDKGYIHFKDGEMESYWGSGDSKISKRAGTQMLLLPQYVVESWGLCV